MTPYPSKRLYLWAAPHLTYSVEQATQLMRRIRRGVDEAMNPQRWEAFTQTIKTIEMLAHERDVSEFPGEKLHKLLIRCADNAGWYTDHSAVSKAFRPVPKGGNLYECQCCKQTQDKVEFERPPTKAQAQKYGWGYKPSEHRVMAHYCRACRDRRVQAQRQERQRKDERRVQRSIDKLKADELLARAKGSRSAVFTGAALADVYKFFDYELRRKRRLALVGINKNTPRSDYHRYRLEMLDLARAELERRVDDGTLSEFINDGQWIKDIDWTHLLPKAQRSELLHAYKSTQTNGRGRPPAL